MNSGDPQRVDRIAQLVVDVEMQARNGDFGGFSKTVTKCLAPPNVIHDVAADSRFWRGLEELLTKTSGANDYTVVLALAEVGRLAGALKSMSKRLRPLAFDLLASHTALDFGVGDADQVTFAAKGWKCSGRPVDLAVASRTVVMADAPKPVAPWLELALEVGDFSSVLEGIAAALTEFPLSETESAKSRSARLQRVLKGLRTALDDRELDTKMPTAIATLVASGFRGAQRPVQYAPSAKAVDDLMSFVLHVIRMDLRFLTEPAIYNSVERARGWLPDGGWLRFTKSARTAAKLRKTLLDGLVILLKQHNPNRALVDCHRMLSPTPQAARAELKAVAQGDREIPAIQQDWLASGGEKAVARHDRDLSETDDIAIAMALLAVEALDRCELVATGKTTDAETGEFVRKAIEARDRVRSIARRRNLQVFGEPGSIVKFSPNAHRLTTPEAAPDNVRIVEPGVESQGSFGVRVVVPASALAC